jgi:hypothetical protein
MIGLRYTGMFPCLALYLNFRLGPGSICSNEWHLTQDKGGAIKYAINITYLFRYSTFTWVWLYDGSMQILEIKGLIELIVSYRLELNVNDKNWQL